MSGSTSSPPGMWEPPSPEALQAMIPQYEILGFLGRGGMGAVYRGKQIRLDREVAIKVLPETLTQSDNDELKFAERFELEARAMAKFNHPSIVSVFDFGETSEGQLFFVMEFVEGMDIHQYLRENGGAISQEYALSITAHVLDALEYSHSRGIVHRDIKPANILLNTEGQVKIADFGLAKVLTDTGEKETPALTMSNVALGTPDFVAPEALDGDSIPDHRADLYAVGVMLYQMLTGKIPRGQFPMPSEISKDLDPRVDEIIEKALQYDPGDRFPSAGLMRAALEPVISAPLSRFQKLQESNSHPPSKKRLSSKQSTVKKKTGSGLKLYLVAATVVFLGALIYYFTRSTPEVSAPIVEAAGNKPNESKTQPVKSASSNQRPDPAMKAEDKGDGGKATGPKAPTTEIKLSEQGGEHPTPEESTVENPYENSLGMKFSPVPIIGGATDAQLILFSIWETRVQDYNAYKDANPSVKQGIPGFKQDPTHPAVHIKHTDAIAFCQWLTVLEMKKGNLSEGQQYRLPTDHEWSCAIGIGKMEDPLATPQAKNKKLEKLFPWGSEFPPPDDTFNAYGQENEKVSINGTPKIRIKNYSDPFQFTAPVNSLQPNQFGLFHMTGNAVEWTSDWFDETKIRIASRSASWSNAPAGFFLSSARASPFPDASMNGVGFRVVLEPNKIATPQPPTSTSPETAPSDSLLAEIMPKKHPENISPLASVPGLESRLSNYVKFRQKLIRDLSEKYLGALDGRFDGAISSGNLSLAESIKAEKASVQELKASLEEMDKDPFVSFSNPSTLNNLPEETPQALSVLREIWISERSKIANQLSTNLEKSLKALEVELTKAADLENATIVRDLRESMKTEQAAGSSPQASQQTTKETVPSPPTAFENSIGMEFLPLEVDGSYILLSVYETTVNNFKRFIRDNKDINWPEPPWRLRDNQAAVMLTWDDATAFCSWLTEEERRKGAIAEGDEYTLPSLLELRFAAGVVESYDSSKGRINYKSKYLWGNEWPIPGTPGNFFGEENGGNPGRKTPISGYDDGFTQIAEVGSFEPNSLGFYDLVGNAWEWCEDWSIDKEEAKTLYGASSMSSEERTLKSDFNNYANPTLRSTAYGFRIVLRR